MKRIRNLDKHLNHVPDGATFSIGVKLENLSKANIDRSGLLSIALNQSTTPSMVGPITRFNARGKYKSLKDLPKKERYITTREWTREEWIGGGQTQTVTNFVDIYRLCYQQSFIEPFSIEIIKIRFKGMTYFSSVNLTKKTKNTELIIHTINVFLELFGEFEILSDAISNKIQTVRVNWRFLPPGKNLWQKVLAHIKENNKKGPAITNVINARQEFIESLDPVMTYIGENGFSDYIAYVFKDFTILESIAFGNAMYIFEKDWKLLSQLTKAELISKSLAKRIVHSDGWKAKVNALFPKNK